MLCLKMGTEGLYYLYMTTVWAPRWKRGAEWRWWRMAGKTRLFGLQAVGRLCTSLYHYEYDDSTSVYEGYVGIYIQYRSLCRFSTMQSLTRSSATAAI